MTSPPEYPTDAMIEAGFVAFHRANKQLHLCSDRELVAEIYLAMHRASPGGDEVERLVEFVQDKLDDGNRSDDWWKQFDTELRERLAALVSAGIQDERYD